MRDMVPVVRRKSSEVNRLRSVLVHGIQGSGTTAVLAHSSRCPQNIRQGRVVPSTPSLDSVQKGGTRRRASKASKYRKSLRYPPAVSNMPDPALRLQLIGQSKTFRADLWLLGFTLFVQFVTAMQEAHKARVVQSLTLHCMCLPRPPGTSSV